MNYVQYQIHHLSWKFFHSVRTSTNAFANPNTKNGVILTSMLLRSDITVCTRLIIFIICSIHSIMCAHNVISLSFFFWNRIQCCSFFFFVFVFVCMLWLLVLLFRLLFFFSSFLIHTFIYLYIDMNILFCIVCRFMLYEFPHLEWKS